MARLFKSLHRWSVLRASEGAERERREVFLNRKEALRKQTARKEGREGKDLEISVRDGRE